MALVLTSRILFAFAQGSPDATELVRQLAQFQPGIDPRAQSDTGLPIPAEQRRAEIYAQLRTLADQAVPALQAGLTDEDVQIRRNVALYLAVQGESYVRPSPLSVRPFLSQLVGALRDSDERVKALSAQALGHIGADAVIAVPALIRFLDDPDEGLRNSACIALADIGPVARDALPALRRHALSDPSNDVRRFAQRAIAR